MKTRKFAAVLSTAAVLSSVLVGLNLTTTKAADVVKSSTGLLSQIGEYKTGITNEDGGVAEIVKYNTENKRMYLVNGAKQSVDIVDVSGLTSSTKKELNLYKRLDVKAIGAANGFTCGDITSVSVNTKYDVVALAVQADGYSKTGHIVLVDYDGNYVAKFACGVQPDMVTFSKDNNLILSADEGEPREGYATAGSTDPVDPKGSVTVVDLTNGIQKATTSILDFTSFDAKRDELVGDGVILKKETNPSVDFEPEYITVSEDSKKAYVTLQEANAIATVDLATKTITTVKSLGFKDHSQAGNEIDILKDGSIGIKKQDVYGAYMPDGCDAVTINGKTYVLTANEGDGREWGSGSTEYSDEKKVEMGSDNSKVTTIDTSGKDGLDATKTYLFGARSFSIWDADTMNQVYDSGNQFEKITARTFLDYFNASNDEKPELDDRSGKKGPEAETVAAMKVGGKTYAFTGLERIGGVMIYDISDPTKPQFKDYMNLRNFNGTTLETAGSLAPEGLCAIEAKDSPTGHPIMLVANEISGNIDVLQVNEGVERKATTITATNKTATYKGKAFYLGAKTNGNGKLTYKSNNTNVVKVDGAGKVTIVKPGRTTITIQAAQTDTYSVATKTITVTVKPKKVSLTKVRSFSKKTLKVYWKKDTTVSGYQVTIARNSKFTTSKKSSYVKSNKTAKKTMSKLKRKKTYYVKVRSYKLTGKTKIFGSYSRTLKIKVK